MEAVVGLVIILTGFSITLVIFMNVISSSNSKSKLETQISLREAALETKLSRQYIDGEEKMKDLVIERSFERYDENSQLLLFELKAINSKKKVIGVRKELILSYQ